MGEIIPDAIFVGNDHMAFAVMETIRTELGLRIPEDVSVVGYDDVSMSEWPSFNLTTIRQPANRMVEETVKMLLSMINGDFLTVQKLEIDASLQVRGSALIPEEWPNEEF